MQHDSIETAFGDFMRAFEAFKDGNDERLRELERRSSADVVTTDKVDRLNRALDETRRVVDDLALKAARPHLGGSANPAPRSAAALQHKAAFDAYVRKGDASTLRDLESKALSVGTDADGGYLVPDELERAVNRAVRNVSPIRAIAGIRQVSSSVYKKPFAITGAEAGWIAETAARPETDTPTLAELSFPTMELYDHTPRVRQLHSRGICYLAREASSARACSKKGLIGTMPHCDPHSDHSLRSSSSLASEASRSSR